MAGGKTQWVVSWDGQQWACVRATARSGADVFSIDEAFAVAGEGSVLPPRVEQALRTARRRPVVLIDTTVPLMAREVTVPLVAEEKQAATIAAEVNRAVPFAPEEISWDAVVLEEDAIEQRLLLLAARTAEWEAARAAVAAAAPGMRCETYPVALLNVWARLNPKPGKPSVVALPLEGSSLLLFSGEETSSLRLARGGLGAGEPESLNRLRGEWTRAIAAHRRQQSIWKPEFFWLLGSAAETSSAAWPAVAGLVPQKIEAPAMLEALPLAGLDQVPPTHRWAVAGALLAASGEPYHASHLMTAEARDRSAGGQRHGWLWAAAALFVAAGLLAWWPAWQARQELVAQESALRTRAAPAKAHAAALDRLQAVTAREHTVITGIADLARSRSNWTQFLVDLQARLSAVENVWIDSLEVLRPAPPATDGTEPIEDEFAEPDAVETTAETPSQPLLRLRLGGRLLDPEHPLQRVSPEMRARVNDLIDGLAGSDYVQAVTDTRFVPLDGGLLQFTFTLTLHPDRRL